MMNKLSIENINRKSPYHVVMGDKDNFGFITESGILYDISFMEDLEIAGCQTYQFSIRRLSETSQGYDGAVKDTILDILEEFFDKNHTVLLYICDDADGREAARNRLFVKWFVDYNINGRFVIRTADTIVEGHGFYTAIIVENCHPCKEKILYEFDFVAKNLTEK